MPEALSRMGGGGQWRCDAAAASVHGLGGADRSVGVRRESNPRPTVDRRKRTPCLPLLPRPVHPQGDDGISISFRIEDAGMALVDSIIRQPPPRLTPPAPDSARGCSRDKQLTGAMAEIARLEMELLQQEVTQEVSAIP